MPQQGLSKTVLLREGKWHLCYNLQGIHSSLVYTNLKVELLKRLQGESCLPSLFAFIIKREMLPNG